MTVREIVPTGELHLSARLAQPQGRSRGLVVALHGGTYDSGYYDGGPDSLLELGALLGYTVVALDRPGYGRSAGCSPDLLTFAAQSRVVAEAVDILADRHSPDGVVLIGHSIGGMVALRVASESKAPLAGVEVSGLGERWQPGLREMWGSLIGDAAEVAVPAEAHAQVMFGPAGTFDPDQLTRDRDLLRPMPMPELVDVVDWADTLPSVAARIDVPVSLTLAEHDGIWQSDRESRSLVAGRFTGSPSVRVELFERAGHCIELHLGARAYCLRQLGFVAEVLGRNSSPAVARG